MASRPAYGGLRIGNAAELNRHRWHWRVSLEERVIVYGI
jgi:hypothetical protein